MARVPVSNIGSVQSRAVPTVYDDASGATLDAFGGAQARALQEGAQKIGAAGDLLAKRALEIQQEDNEREVKNADVQLSQRIRAITLGDGEKEGYFSMRGEAAVQGYKTTEKAIRDAQREVAASIKNPRARQDFGQIAAGRVERELGGLSRHVAKERRVANDAVSEARIKEAADDAAGAYNDPKVVGQSMAIVRQEVIDMGQRNGWPPEVTASKLQEAATVLHRQVIERALVNDPAAAAAYYKANKDKIDGRVRADIEKALETGTMRQQSQGKADEIMARGLGEREALAEARKIKDPKVRDEVVARVSKRYSEARTIKAGEDRDRREGAWKHVLGGGSLDDLAPAQLAAIDGTTVSAMRTFENNRAKDGRGYAKATVPETYNKLHRLFMDDKEAFADYDINQHIGELDERDYQYWLREQRGLDKKAEADKARGASYTLGDRMAVEYMKAAKIDPNKKGANAEKAQKVYNAVRSVVDEFHKDGKKPTREDIKKSLDQLFISGEIKGSGFAGIFADSGRFFEFAGGKDAKKFVITDVKGQEQAIAGATGVPVEHVGKIAEALKARGKELNFVNIQTVWEEAQRGKR
ncbi:MAG: hypothetical protein VW338_14950 [Rhodospirillaceae bacterium]